jgi:hypothetical protein
LEATLHSNIARESNTGTLVDYVDVPIMNEDGHGPEFYNPDRPSSDSINDLYDGYVLTVNNFYTPKTYEYTDLSMLELQFWFKNRYGVKTPIFYIFNDKDHDVFASHFLLFKIECELLTI